MLAVSISLVLSSAQPAAHVAPSLHMTREVTPRVRDLAPGTADGVHGVQGDAGQGDGVQGDRVADTAAQVLSVPLYFVAGGDKLTTASRAHLKRIAAHLRAHPELPRAVVTGHTDGAGSSGANAALSLRRARAVLRLLMAEKVPQQIEAVGLGETRPVATNTTAAGRAQNRRVTIETPPVRVKTPNDGPLAHVSMRRGAVSRKEPTADWASAAVGDGLFRAWRVKAGERSAADVTYFDTSVVRLRSHTLVVVFGSADQVQKAAPARLESGTLIAFVDRLAADPVELDTTGGQVRIVDGRTVVSASGATSRVSNHRGAPVTVTGRGAARDKKVAVPMNYGTRVVRNQAPEKPRQLPAAPAMRPGNRHFACLDGAAGRVSGTWAPVPGAVRTHVELAAEAGGSVAAFDVPGDVTAFELVGLPAGTYEVRLSSVDGIGLEGRPGAPTTLSLQGLAGGACAAAAAPVQPGEPGAPAVPSLWPGTQLAVPEGWTCSPITAGAPVRCVSPDKRVVDVFARVPKLELDPIAPVAPGKDVAIAVHTGMTALPKALVAQVGTGAGATRVPVTPTEDEKGTRIAWSADVPAQASGAAVVTLLHAGAPIARFDLPVQADTKPPVVRKVWLDETASGPVIRVDASDAEQGGLVLTAFAKRGDGPYRPYRLHKRADGTYAHALGAAVEPTALSFYVEATDAAGNGPARVGGVDAPLVAARVAAARWAQPTVVGLTLGGLGAGLGAIAAGLYVPYAQNEQAGLDAAVARGELTAEDAAAQREALGASQVTAGIASAALGVTAGAALITAGVLYQSELASPGETGVPLYEADAE